MRIKHITSPEVFRELVEILAPEHFEEVGNTRVYDLAPDWERYARGLEEGDVVALFAFQGGKPIGYSINFVSTHIHYSNQWVMTNDVIFVAKAHRSGTAGGRLLKENQAIAKYIGCTALVYHAKPNTALNSLLAKRAVLHEHVYMAPL